MALTLSDPAVLKGVEEVLIRLGEEKKISREKEEARALLEDVLKKKIVEISSLRSKLAETLVEAHGSGQLTKALDEGLLEVDTSTGTVTSSSKFDTNFNLSLSNTSTTNFNHNVAGGSMSSWMSTSSNFDLS